jgi:rhodanese-related sulfurtransferase
VEEARTRPGSRIIDVRTPQEYDYGHVKGALNIPLDSLQKIQAKVPDMATPLYVYCLSGARSARACSQLRAMGYSNIINIGGINSYGGPVVSR